MWTAGAIRRRALNRVPLPAPTRVVGSAGLRDPIWSAARRSPPRRRGNAPAARTYSAVRAFRNDVIDDVTVSPNEGERATDGAVDVIDVVTSRNNPNDGDVTRKRVPTSDVISVGITQNDVIDVVTSQNDTGLIRGDVITMMTSQNNGRGLNVVRQYVSGCCRVQNPPTCRLVLWAVSSSQIPCKYSTIFYILPLFSYIRIFIL